MQQKKTKEIVIFQRKHKNKKTSLRIHLAFFTFFLVLFLDSLIFTLLLPSSEQVSQLQSSSAFFTRSLNMPLKQDAENIDSKNQTANQQIYLHGPRDKKEIALTFDADMTPGMMLLLKSKKASTYYDKRVTDVLDSTNTKATIFLTGMWIELYPDIVSAFAKNPLLELGNHSYSHPSFSGFCYGLPQISSSQDKDEIEKTQKLLKEYTGTQNKYFRFPGGCYSQKDLTLTSKENLKVVHWDVVANDGFNKNTVSIVHNVESHVDNGSIIVMHLGGPENTPNTADALPIIIDDLKKREFTFVKISDLLNRSDTSKIVSIASLLPINSYFTN